MRISLVVVVILVLAGFCFGSTNWPNELAGSTVLTDFPFDAKAGSGWASQYPGGKIVSDPTAPFSPGNVLEETWQNHNYPDIANMYYSFPAGVKEFYVGLWWKPSNPFYGWLTTQQQKILLLEGSHTYCSMYRKSGTGASSVYSLWMQPDAGNNNCHVASGVSCDILYPNVSAINIALGQWHRIEWYMKASTTASSQDGVVRWWLDGTLMGSYTNINTTARTFGDLRTYHWDNSPDPQIATDYHRFDHAHISLPNGVQYDPLLISTGSLPSAQSGKAYTAYLKAQGGKSPYSWTISAGTLLPGLSLNKATGVISGTPATGGKCDFTIKVLDSSVPPIEATKAFSIIASGSSSMVAAEQLSVVGSQLSVESKMGSVLFRMPQSGKYTLSVYDLSGREVWRHAGSEEAVWNHSGKLKKGVYLVRAQQNGKAMNTSFCHVW